MKEHKRIVSDPEILLGKPVVRGTRVPVGMLEDILAALQFAAG